jgi:hypothetical protein
MRFEYPASHVANYFSVPLVKFKASKMQELSLIYIHNQAIYFLLLLLHQIKMFYAGRICLFIADLFVGMTS